MTDRADPTYFVEPGLAGRLGPFLRDRGLPGQAFLISDENVYPRHGEAIMASLADAGFAPSARIVPATEASKSLAVASDLFAWLAECGAERRDVVIALGGGLVGDLAGFVAATYLRGVAIVQVPTTLLAQVDSAIGGKTAVNLPVGKNLVGAWHAPHTIVVDPVLLATLSRREISAGWVETLKHALIMDPDLLEIVEREADALLRLDLDVTTEVVRLSGNLKVSVVAEDPFERGRRIILNYGHTIGHALEAAAGYGRLLHGEAVAIGIHAVALLAERMGASPADLRLRQTELLQRYGLELVARDVDPALVRSAMRLDKKVSARLQRWVLLERVGGPIVRSDIPEEAVSWTLDRIIVPR